MSTKAQTQNIKVNVNEANAPDLDLLANSIIEIADAFRKIQNSKLTERAILVLLQDYTGLPKGQIKTILDAVPRIAKYYTK